MNSGRHQESEKKWGKTKKKEVLTPLNTFSVKSPGDKGVSLGRRMFATEGRVGRRGSKQKQKNSSQKSEVHTS
jgi:hypothetical protein